MKVNFKRSSCKDLFKSFILANVDYKGIFEFPVIRPTYDIPRKLIRFSKAVSNKNDFHQWVHFYEDDYQFERIWRSPQRYLHILKQYDGVILPDFSLYRDMPLAMQIWNIFRSRTIGVWLQQNDVKVIPNIRYGDYRTARCCCDGIASNCVIAIGSHGTIKNKADREIFLACFEYVINILKPSAIVIYGAMPNKCFQKYIDAGICIVNFESDYAIFHREVV